MAEDDVNDMDMDDDDDVDMDVDAGDTDVGLDMDESEPEDFESRAKRELETYSAEIEQLKGETAATEGNPDMLKKLEEKKQQLERELNKLKNQAGDEGLRRDIRTRLDSLRDDIRQAASEA